MQENTFQITIEGLSQDIILENTIRVFKENIDNLLKQLNDARTTISKLEYEKKTFSEESSILRNREYQLSGEIKNLHVSLGEKSETINNLNRSVEKLHHDIEDLNIKIEQLEENIKTQLQDSAVLRNENEKLLKDKDNLTKELTRQAEDYQSLSDSYHTLSLSIDQLTKKQASLQEALNDTTQKKDEQTKRIEEFIGEEQKKSAEIESLKKSHSDLEEKLSNTESSLSSKTRDYDSTKSQLDDLTHGIDCCFINYLSRIVDLFKASRANSNNPQLNIYLDNMLIKEDGNNKGLSQIHDFSDLYNTLSLTGSAISQLCTLVWWYKQDSLTEEFKKNWSCMDKIANDLFPSLLTILEIKGVSVNVPASIEETIPSYCSNENGSNAFKFIFGKEIAKNYEYKLCEISKLSYNGEKGECFIVL